MFEWKKLVEFIAKKMVHDPRAEYTNKKVYGLWQNGVVEVSTGFLAEDTTNIIQEKISGGPIPIFPDVKHTKELSVCWSESFEDILMLRMLMNGKPDLEDFAAFMTCPSDFVAHKNLHNLFSALTAGDEEAVLSALASWASSRLLNWAGRKSS